MADLDYTRDAGLIGRGENASGDTTHRIVTFSNMMGAIVSLSLIAGIGVWGYKLVIRDVSGLPIVRAAENEMRVRPEDPGGQLAEHQGLAVNEIAALGTASGPVDQVVLAPPGVALADEDQPIVTVAAPVIQPTPLAPVEDAFDAPAGEETAAAEPEAPAYDNPIDAVIAELMRETPQPIPAQADGGSQLVAQPAVLIGEAPVRPGATGPSLSMRPKLRPLREASLARPASFTPQEPTREIDPAAIPAGTRLAQLGAFESPEVARAEWTRMEARFGDILEGKSRVIEEAQSGGRTFYRLRAMGFLDVSDTRRFCSAVAAEGVECIPVQAK